MTTRAALHTLLDTLPDDALPEAEAALTEIAANDELTPEEEAALVKGFASIDAGRTIPAEEVYARIDAMLAAKGAARRSA
jgi:predicted transcriptional regulator